MYQSTLSAAAWPFITGADDALLQAIGLVWDGDDPPQVAVVDGMVQQLTWSTPPQQPAYAVALVPLRDASRVVQIHTQHAGTQYMLDCEVEPPPRWELFLVPHSHVDIGYTEHPDILSDAHGDYIAQALDLMRATDELPHAQRYHWTCEASWSVEQFLRRHPSRVDEFVARVREGRMEVTALYVNMTDLFGERLLEEAVRYALELRARYDIEIVSACNYDVNGFGWALPSILQQAGVRYLDTAINETRALGVRPRPSPYRWAAPNGADVLLWHSRGYLLGNDLLLHASAGWAAPRVAQFLTQARRDGYPHSGMQALISGHKGDSMPPTATVCAVVEEWNRTWRWPQLRLTTVRDWFEHLEQHWPQPIVRQQCAWPDWWADGNGSALVEAALARTTQARLAGLEAQRGAIQRAGIALQRLDAQYATAWRRTMLFCEHTWGPYETALAPHGAAACGQWHSKAAHVYAAAALADSIEAEQMVALATAGELSARAAGLTNATLQGVPFGDLATGHARAVLVFNPLPQTRSDLVRVHVPGHVGGRTPQLRDARTGDLVAAHVRPYPPEDVVNAAHIQVEFLAGDLAPHGHHIFWIEPGAESPAPRPDSSDATEIENAHVRVQVDPHTGAITSIRHKA
ncbi:MAG: hypothetical protein H7Y32_10490, partial [Chloroflexales bacterium]|nr:hypothetical protein [Chloroflexales bacterium]